MDLVDQVFLVMVKLMAAVLALAFDVGLCDFFIAVVHEESVVEAADADDSTEGDQDKTQGAIVLELF